MNPLSRNAASVWFSLCLLMVYAARVFPREGTKGPQSAQQNSAKLQASPAVSEKTAEKHSTLEDRQRLVAIAHKLEAAPLDPALASERDWAVKWVIAAPDVHVRICTNLLADLRRPKYKYRSEISDQLLISSAAFLIEHPDQAENYQAQSVGGMEGVLKAYSAIIKAEPQATAKSLDALLEKQRQGRLADAVAELGFIVNVDDQRLRVAACPGAPACAHGLRPVRAEPSGHLSSRRMLL